MKYYKSKEQNNNWVVGDKDSLIIFYNFTSKILGIKSVKNTENNIFSDDLYGIRYHTHEPTCFAHKKYQVGFDIISRYNLEEVNFYNFIDILREIKNKLDKRKAIYEKNI